MNRGFSYSIMSWPILNNLERTREPPPPFRRAAAALGPYSLNRTASINPPSPGPPQLLPSCISQPISSVSSPKYKAPLCHVSPYYLFEYRIIFVPKKPRNLFVTTRSRTSSRGSIVICHGPCRSARKGWQIFFVATQTSALAITSFHGPSRGALFIGWSLGIIY